ncbi:MAG TPA: histidine kinase N-terminal 7TM domain-containing protein [Kouleothrix sp.]|nr:histidine kinase N-terminal 7TM domain-containing protein [Kouleothrix sp.]
MSALPSIILYLIPACISAGLALYGWQRRTTEARPFSLLMLAVAFWSLCHTFSVGSPTHAWALFWAQVQYAGIVAVGPCWLLFALAYARRQSRAGGLTVALLTLPPALAYLAVLTNGWHHMWWSRIEPDPTRPFVALAVQRGVLFWLHFLYSYACVGLGLGFFIYALREPRLLYRSQAEFVLLAALFPIVGNIAYVLGGFQIRAIDDPTPFLFTASGALMFYATRQYQLLNLTPIAQQEIVDEMPDGLVVLDRHGAIAAANPAAARLLAVGTDAWLGRGMPELAAHSALAAAIVPLLNQADRATGTTSATVEYRADAGSHVVEARLRPIGGSRSRAGTLLLLRDVTDRAQIERQLDRRLAELTLLSQIASLANAAAYTDDLLRAITGEIVRAMHWDRVMIGLLQPDGQALRVVVDDAPGVASFANATVSASEFGIIFEIVGARASRVLALSDPALHDTRTAAEMANLGLQTMLVVPLYQRDEPLGAMAMGYTTALAIQAENLRLYETVGRLVSDAITRARLYEAANEASALKSAFLATVSHELRTPLTSIIGYADMLDQGVFGPLPERTFEPLSHIRRSGQMLLQLINDILDFSKLEAGHFSIDLYPVDVASVIASVVGALQPQIRARALVLELQLERDLPLVRANSSRLEQIVTNVLANAVKFTERGTIRVAAEERGGRLVLSVQDTGIGIAPEQLQRIFQPFHQVDNQLTRRFGGTGLGLAISQRMLELMHGTIHVVSAPGHGSTFTIELPIAEVGALREREHHS